MFWFQTAFLSYTFGLTNYKLLNYGSTNNLKQNPEALVADLQMNVTGIKPGQLTMTDGKPQRTRLERYK